VARKDRNREARISGVEKQKPQPSGISQQQSMSSYYLKNLSDGMLMVDTRLNDASTPRKKYVSFLLMKEKGELLLQPMAGYSAKEIFNSKGVMRLEQKGKLRRLEKKQLIMVKN